MVSSFLVSLVFLALARSGNPVSVHVALLITAATTTVCWVVTAFVTPPTDRAVLVDFYRRVRPVGPGWTAIRAEAGPVPSDGGDNITMGLVGWVAGSIMIWSALFTVGNILYGRRGIALALAVIACACAAVVVWVMRQQWPESPTDR